MTYKRVLAVIFLSLGFVICALFILLSVKNIKLLSVQTASMSPAIEKGDLVAVTRVPDDQLAVGDVVTYINPANKNQTITHRVIAVPSETNQQRFITRGDANPAPDAPVVPSAIVGRSGFTLPYAGYVFDVVRHPIGLIALIYIPALVVIVGEIRRLSEYYRRKEPYFASEAIKKRKQYRINPSKSATVAKLVALVVVGIGILSIPALAALSSSATLAGNTITTKSVPPVPPTPPASSCSNNVNVTNNNTQNAQTGNVAVSGNTTGGSATSGNASNSSSTGINISTNCN